MKDVIRKNEHLIYNQILIYKDILIHQRKKLYHLRTRWRLERKTKLLPDIESYFDERIEFINEREKLINQYVQKYFINFSEMQKLDNVYSEHNKSIYSEHNKSISDSDAFGLSFWMKYGELYGSKRNVELNTILGQDYHIKDFNPFFVDDKKEDYDFNSVYILDDLQEITEHQYQTISLIEHCFNQRVQGSQIPVLDTRVTDVEKIGGNQIMYYAADSLVLDYLNKSNFNFAGVKKLDDLWKGLTNFGYSTNFMVEDQIIVAPGWSKYLQSESWILFSHECGHLILNRLINEEQNKDINEIPSFIWDEIPSNNSRLIKYLSKIFGDEFNNPDIIEKMEDDRAIYVFKEGLTLIIRLDRYNKRAIATFNEIKKDFFVKIENDKLNIYEQVPALEIINDIAETISPLFETSRILKISYEIFSDIYAIFMGGIYFLPPFLRLHFSTSIERNKVPVFIPLRIEICKQTIKELGLDEKYIENFVESLDLNKNTSFLLANFELVKKYRKNMFLFNKSLKIMDSKIMDMYYNNMVDEETLESMNEELFNGSRNEFKKITDEIISLDYFKDIGQDFSRKGIINDIKNLIKYDFYKSFELVNSLELNKIFNNNIKEIILAIISYDLEEENIPYEKVTLLCNETFELSNELLKDFIKHIQKPENLKRFEYLKPILSKDTKYISELSEILKYNKQITLSIKPRHLISMVARNDKINLNAILFILSHNKNMRLRYS